MHVLSSNSSVIPAPNTGRVNNNSTDAVSIHQVSRHDSIEYIPDSLDTNAVMMNVAAPPSDDAPMMCNANMAMFIDDDDENLASDNGGYIVHPAFSPSSRATDNTTSCDDRSNKYNDAKLSLGDAKSIASHPCGSCQFPTNEIIVGMMNRNIIPNPCDVIIALYISNDPFPVV